MCQFVPVYVTLHVCVCLGVCQCVLVYVDLRMCMCLFRYVPVFLEFVDLCVSV